MLRLQAGIRRWRLTRRTCHLNRELLGGLLYVSIISRPDIANAVRNMAKYSGRHHYVHMQLLKRILRYLSGTINHVLNYDGTTLRSHV